MTTIPSGRQTQLAVIAIIAFTAFAFFQQIPSQGWVSDDYIEVFDNGFVPHRGLVDTLKLCGGGRFSVARVVGLPAKLYGGYWLGQRGSHYVQAVIHLACALMFFRLLLLLDFSIITSTLAAVNFAVAPWMSQAVIWWATMIAPAGTLCVLLAACLYTHLVRDQRRSRLLMPIICLLLLICQAFYELWLFVPVLFICIDLYIRVARTTEIPDKAQMWTYVRQALLTTLPIDVTIFIWALAYKLMPDVGLRDEPFLPRRALIVVLSIHARIYSWITHLPWRSALRDGVQYSGPWWIVLVIALTSLYVLLTWFRPEQTISRGNSFARNVRWRLIAGTLLAWGFFLSSKLVFVFLGGIALHTRHNYGAALGAALLFGLVCDFAYTHYSLHKGIVKFLTISLLLFLSLLAITSAGIRHHYVATSLAEQTTLKQLAPIAAQMLPNDSIVVVGAATNTSGELAYFSEGSGQWLQNWMRQFNPHINCYVVPSVSLTQGQLVFDVAGRPNMRELRLAPDHVRMFRWNSTALIEVRPGN